jgi:thymidylate synthase
MSNPKVYPNFSVALNALKDSMIERSFEVHTEKWQGMDVSKRPEATMRELLFQSFQVLLRGESLDMYAKDIQPNLPWADHHFEDERASGEPINPGETWKIWPWGHSADKFRTEGEQYNHTYAERYWPKFAGQTRGGHLLPGTRTPHRGIRYEYGDLRDVVNLLHREPYTRQAYLPVFFPEDTGVVHGGRIPCTIGYHFLLRGNALHIVYQIRSCDFYRHLRDDIYLTVRLLLWMLESLRERDSFWYQVPPGMFVMHISSLHVFINDWRLLKNSAQS